MATVPALNAYRHLMRAARIAFQGTKDFMTIPQSLWLVLIKVDYFPMILTILFLQVTPKSSRPHRYRSATSSAKRPRSIPLVPRPPSSTPRRWPRFFARTWCRARRQRRARIHTVSRIQCSLAPVMGRGHDANNGLRATDTRAHGARRQRVYPYCWKRQHDGRWLLRWRRSIRIRGVSPIVQSCNITVMIPYPQE